MALTECQPATISLRKGDPDHLDYIGVLTSRRSSFFDAQRRSR